MICFELHFDTSAKLFLIQSRLFGLIVLPMLEVFDGSAVEVRIDRPGFYRLVLSQVSTQFGLTEKSTFVFSSTSHANISNKIYVWDLS